MKKVISVLLTAAILFSSVIAVSAKRDPKDNENGKSKDPVVDTVETTNTTGSSITIVPEDTIDGLKKQIKENHKDKAIRKFLLKILVELRHGGGDETIPVLVNSELVTFDVPPVIKQGRTLIPVRAVTAALGANVEWDADTPNIVTITKTVEGQIITAVIDLETGVITKSVDGADPVPVELDVKPQLINNRTLVPIRFLAEIFGMKVEYDPDTKGVFVDDDQDEEKEAFEEEEEVEEEVVEEEEEEEEV